MTTPPSRLGLAVCALLGLPATAPAADASWEIDTATLYYGESGRVSLLEPMIAARRRWDDDRSLGLKLTLDTLTGPSPNGATPAGSAQTISGPSGNGAATTAPGEIPLDDQFRDTRVALAVDYAAPLLGAWTAAYGLNASNEYDYLSLGGSLRLQRDFNQRNTTLALGLAYASDRLEPVGGVPQPLSVKDASAKADGSTDSKSVTDLLLGITQIIDPVSLVRVNLVLSQSSGYLNDPYKILSVLDAEGEPLRYLYEGRPDRRLKSGLFAEYLRDIDGDTLRGSYRYQTDDWGVDSHTVELAYRLPFAGRQYIEPQLRYYQQTAADFYRVALDEAESEGLQAATADYRLGGMSSVTIGAQYGYRLRSGSELSLRLGYYLQTPDQGPLPAQAAEGLSRFGELVPETTAVMATVGYRFSW